MTFDKAYMDHRLHIKWRGPAIADAIIETLNPVAVLDLGCATGDIVKGLLDRGVEAWGVDNSPAAGDLLPSRRFIKADIVTAGYRLAPAELVILLEVLPILDPAYRLMALAVAADLGSILLVNHLTDEERNWLAVEGWDLDEQATGFLRRELDPWHKKQAVKALRLTGEIWKKTPESGDSRLESLDTGAPPVGHEPSGNSGNS